MESPRLAGKLIVVEGVDEVGKTTLVGGIANQLRAQKEKVLSLAFPGHDLGTLGAHIYALHHRPEEFGIIVEPTSSAVQLLHIATHLDAIERIIRPALERGETVLLDRFWWSTWAYGLARGAGSVLLEKMIDVERSCWNPIVPDLVLFVSRPTPFTPVPDIASWHRIVREYDALVSRESKVQKIVTIRNESGRQEALANAMEALNGLECAILKSKKSKKRKDRSLFEVAEDSADAKASGTNAKSIADAKPEKPALLESHANLPLFRFHASLAPAKPSEVFDTYWKFATKRQEIFFNKQRSVSPPWTDDPILLKHKFTNAYRASDRVSQYLIGNVIYPEKELTKDWPIEELFFRILLFKTFNRVDTWELLVSKLGEIRWSEYSFTRYDDVLTKALIAGKRIYSAAYIMSSGRSAYGSEKKHRNHLQLLEAMMRARVPAKVAESKSMEEVFNLLMSFPSIGSFLAYQYAIDLNYSPITDFTEMDFVVPGPGAKDGIRKCFSDFGGLEERDLIKRMADIQEQELNRLGLDFKKLWGRRLQLIDCQNLFCEVDKYARIAHPEIAGLTGRTRIKQKYSPNPKLIHYWYPPKWKINTFITTEV